MARVNVFSEHPLCFWPVVGIFSEFSSLQNVGKTVTALYPSRVAMGPKTRYRVGKYFGSSEAYNHVEACYLCL